MQALEVDILSLGSYTQSTSQKHVMVIGTVRLNGARRSQWLAMSWWNLKIILNTFQCSFRGLDRNWQTLLETYNISGLVIVAYWNAHTMNLKFVRSTSKAKFWQLCAKGHRWCCTLICGHVGLVEKIRDILSLR